MFTSDNQTLRSISWLIRNRFIAVSSVYGVWSPLQSVGIVKQSIWSAFAQTLCFRFYCAIIVLLYPVLLNAHFCACTWIYCVQ